MVSNNPNIVEVVRCKDCRYFKTDDSVYPWCERLDRDTRKSRYCYWGEKIDSKEIEK